MKITVSVSGKFSMGYQWAAELERRGLLERLITPVPYGRGARFGVSRERTRALWPIGAANWVMQHYAPAVVQPWNQISVSAAFDEAVSRLIGECDAFNGWASMSLRSIRAARRRGVPSVLTIASAHVVTQTRLLEEEARRWGVDAPATHAAVIARTVREYEEADALAAPSEFVRRTLVGEGVDVSKIRLVSWGVAGAGYSKQQTAKRTADNRQQTTDAAGTANSEQQTAKRDGRLRVLFVGAVGLRKGVPYLLEAFRELEAPALLRLVGPVDAALLRAIGGLPDGVEAAGVKTGDALAAEFRDADVFVLPSVEDGFGVVTTEAMAAGLPAIVTSNCGSADAVHDGVNGYVVPACDARALRERLGALLSDADLRARMGAAAAASVQGWSWAESADAHLREIYEPLIGVRREGNAVARAA